MCLFSGENETAVDFVGLHTGQILRMKHSIDGAHFEHGHARIRALAVFDATRAGRLDAKAVVGAEGVVTCHLDVVSHHKVAAQRAHRPRTTHHLGGVREYHVLGLGQAGRHVIARTWITLRVLELYSDWLMVVRASLEHVGLVLGRHYRRLVRIEDDCRNGDEKRVSHY